MRNSSLPNRCRSDAAWRVLVGFLAIVLGGCVSTQIEDTPLLGQSPLCQGTARDLGTVAVYPQTAWRPEQKEPARRAAMAASAIEKAFQSLPCGRLGTIHPMDVPRDWHEANVAGLAHQAGTDTVILIQVFELGPHFVLSFPALWSGSTEVRLRFRALDAESGRVLLDIERRRTVGGAYAIRSADDLEEEMVTVLRGLITN